MVQPQQVQDRRVEVIQRMHVLDRLLAQLIRHPVAHAAAHARSGHPAREPIRIVIPPDRPLLEERHPAKLRAPNHQRVLQQSALAQIPDQCRRRLIEDRCVPQVLFLEFAVTVPVQLPATRIGAIEQLHEPNPLLDQAPRQDAVLREGCLDRVRRVIRAIAPEDVRRFRGQITDLRDAHLHPRCQFIARDPRRQLAIAWMLFQVSVVQLPQQGPRRPIRLRAHPGRGQMPHRILRAERRSLERRRQESRPPVVRAILRNTARIQDGDVRG